MKDILLTTINAKWIHPSLALRLLKANLGELEDRCEIIEFALRQPLKEKIDALVAASPKILGISVSIWNHTATIELLNELKKIWLQNQTPSLLPTPHSPLPIIVLGGPEISYLPDDAEIFQYADYVIKGEGELIFRNLCEDIINNKIKNKKIISVSSPDYSRVVRSVVKKIKSAYHLYTDEDIAQKLIYVESSRGCPFNCDFCLSAADKHPVREFPLEPFLSEMEILINRGVKTFKFLDRTFNANIKRAITIMEFFLEKLKERRFTVHFEMVPTLFTTELLETLTRFPPGSLRLEVGIQTLNPQAAALINLPGRQTPNTAANDKILETVRFLRQKTNAIIHADLIAGLPGEDMGSFATGFDQLWEVLERGTEHTEIQLGILKLLPGAPIARHNKEWGMKYNPEPPYEVLETSAMSATDIARLKNFARFWELIVNRGCGKGTSCLVKNSNNLNFHQFMELSDMLFAHFGRNWGINKEELLAATLDILEKL